ncbi:MAG: hypothetical protein IKA03_01660 [Alphaproteobacteria bacterium]|nr:hypothetical protein [Alphaproteobacteria bacterium]
MTYAFEKQAPFASKLMQVGDVLPVFVIPGSDGRNQVKSRGGILGKLSSETSLETGTSFDGEVVGFEENIPIFAPTKEWLFSNQQQEATVICVFPRGIAMDTECGKLIYYESDKLSEDLQELKEGDTVFAKGLTKEISNGCEMYKASSLTVAPQVEKTKPTSSMEPWDQEQVEQALRQGSRKMFGKAKLGKVVTVVDCYYNHAKLLDGTDVYLVEDKMFPKWAKRAFVRIVFISQDNRVTVELIRVENTQSDKPYTRTTTDNDPTSVGYWNKAFADDASNQGSKWLAGPYQLGRNYKVELDEDGKPIFKPTMSKPQYPVNSVRVTTVKKDCDCQAFDEVSCRIDFIHYEGNGNYVFEVTILKVL